MNQHHVTAWIRLVTHLPSRRDVLRGIAGAGLGLATLRLPPAVEGKEKRKKNKKKNRQALPPPAVPCTPKCGHKECGDDGCGGSCGGCATDQVCVTGTCCTPPPLEARCITRCGRESGCPYRCDSVSDPRSCSQPIDCSCPRGNECLANGTCGQICENTGDCLGQGSDCFNCAASAEGTKHCSLGGYCSEKPCTSTADCSDGKHCAVTSCGPQGSSKTLCIPLCTG
jgi:hypothetical protein